MSGYRVLGANVTKCFLVDMQDRRQSIRDPDTVFYVLSGSFGDVAALYPGANKIANVGIGILPDATGHDLLDRGPDGTPTNWSRENMQTLRNCFDSGVSAAETVAHVGLSIHAVTAFYDALREGQEALRDLTFLRELDPEETTRLLEARDLAVRSDKELEKVFEGESTTQTANQPNEEVCSKCGWGVVDENHIGTGCQLTSGQIEASKGDQGEVVSQGGRDIPDNCPRR